MKMSFHHNSIVSLVYSCYYISIKECLKMLFAGCASQFVEMVFQTRSDKSSAEVAKSNKQWAGNFL